MDDDFLSKLAEKLEAPKWQERKQALESLKVQLKTQKFSNGLCGNLVNCLVKVIAKDKNVNVIVIAEECLTNLATTMKQHFKQLMPLCVPVLLEKFKDKNSNVLKSNKEAIDAAFQSTQNLDAIMPEIFEALDNKNPSVKLETTSFLNRCFKSIKVPSTSLKKKNIKAYAEVLIKQINGSDVNLRNGSAEALGTLMKLIGEEVLEPFVINMEPAKLAKIKDFCKNAIVAREDPMEETPDTKHNTQRKKTNTERSTENHDNDNKALQKKKVKLTERDLSMEEVKEICSNLLPSDVIAGLSDENWKKRLQSMQALTETIETVKVSNLPVQAFVKIISKKPGLKDTNFQVLRMRLNALKIIAEKSASQPEKFSCITADCILTDVTDKLGDLKNGNGASELLTAVVKCTSLDYVVSNILSHAMSQKNPKVQQEALTWSAKAMIKADIKSSLLKALIDYIKKAFSAANPSVRNSAISLLGVIYMKVGPSLISHFESEKSTIKKQIFAEFEKCDEIKKQQEENLEADLEMDEHMSENLVCEVDIRRDITPYINEETIDGLNNSDAIVRIEMLTKTQDVVINAKYIKPNLGKLPEALIKCLNDSNCKIVRKSLKLSIQIAEAMGVDCKHHSRNFFPHFLQCLGHVDVKVQRESVKCINLWTEKVGYEEIFDAEQIVDALKRLSASSVFKAKLWFWIGDTLRKISPKDISKKDVSRCLDVLYRDLLDTNDDVAHNAREATSAFMLHLEYKTLFQYADKTKDINSKALKEILEKIKIDHSNANCPKEIHSEAVVENRSSLFLMNNLKCERAERQRCFKIPSAEDVNHLRAEMEKAGVNVDIIPSMFHTDSLHHVKAIELLQKDLKNSIDALISNLDLVLTWLSLIFYEANPCIVLKGLDYLTAVFSRLEMKKYQLYDNEASAFIPCLISRIGDSNDAIRNGVHFLLKQIHNIYPRHRVFSYLLNNIDAENFENKSERLAMITDIIKNNVSKGNGVFLREDLVKEIAKHVSDISENSSVRNAALHCLAQAYHANGDNIFSLVDGLISEDDRSQLRNLIRATENDISVFYDRNIDTTYVVKARKEKLSEADLIINNQSTQNSLSQPNVNIRKLLENLRDSDNEVATAAVQSIQEIFISDEVELLDEKFADEFLNSIVINLKVLNIVSRKLSQVVNINQHWSYFTAVNAFYGSKFSLGKRVSTRALKNILQVYLSLITNPKISDCEVNGKKIFKILNSECLNMLKNSNRTNIICALVRLLAESVESKADEQTLDLVHKCIWCVEEFIPIWKEDLDSESVLSEVYNFLVYYPSRYWKDKPNTETLQTIKTLLVTMYQNFGDNLIKSVTNNPKFHNSELEIYLMHFKHVKEVKTYTIHEIFGMIRTKTEHREGLYLLFFAKASYQENEFKRIIQDNIPTYENYLKTNLKKLNDVQSLFSNCF